MFIRKLPLNILHKSSSCSLLFGFSNNFKNLTSTFLKQHSTLKLSKHPNVGLLNQQHKYLFSTENNPENNKKAHPLTREQRFKQKEDELLKQDPQGEEEDTYKTQSGVMKYVLGISVIAIVMVYGFMEIQTVRAQKKVDKSITGMTKVTSTGKAKIGGPWQLFDTKGNKFGSENLNGSYYLIYFGFTNCPDICPNSLIKLSRALQKIRKMPQYQYMSIKTVFVSVDPDRDTPEKIDKFLAYFDKSIIGVTGKSNNDDQLKQCMKSFKIYASKIQFEDEDVTKQGRKSYTIDHTILTYLMSDQNEYLTHLGGNMGEHELAKAIVEKILANEHEKMSVYQTK